MVVRRLTPKLEALRDRLVAQRAAAAADRARFEDVERRQAELARRLRVREENLVLGAFADAGAHLDLEPDCERCARGRRMAEVIDELLAGDPEAWVRLDASPCVAPQRDAMVDEHASGEAPHVRVRRTAPR